MIKIRLKQSLLISYAPHRYIDNILINVTHNNGLVTPFTSLQCEFHYKGDYETYTISCRSLKVNKIMMDMFGDTQLFFNNRQSFSNAIKKIVEKYFEDTCKY